MNVKQEEIRTVTKALKDYRSRQLAAVIDKHDEDATREVKTTNRILDRIESESRYNEALHESEYHSTLRMLKADTSEKGLIRYAIFRFGCTSGLRAAEMSALRWENFSSCDGEYSVTFMSRGNANKTLRTVPVEKEALEALDMAYRHSTGKSPSPKASVLVASHRNRMTKATIHNRVKEIEAAAKSAGLMRGNLVFSTRTMRHTAFTLMAERGVPLDVIQRLAGHSTMGSTSRYLHTEYDSSEILNDES